MENKIVITKEAQEALKKGGWDPNAPLPEGWKHI